MTTLKETLQQNYIAAYKAGDKLTAETLKSVRGAVQTAEKSGKTAREFGDDQVLEIIAAQAKQRRQSIEDYRKVGADDRAKQEAAELKILETYLPAQLSEAEIGEIADAVIADNAGANFNQIMKAVSAQTKFRAEGKVVAGIVKAKLA